MKGRNLLEILSDKLSVHPQAKTANLREPMSYTDHQV